MAANFHKKKIAGIVFFSMGVIILLFTSIFKNSLRISDSDVLLPRFSQNGFLWSIFAFICMLVGTYLLIKSYVSKKRLPEAEETKLLE